jgi:hypothetical protein
MQRRLTLVVLEANEVGELFILQSAEELRHVFRASNVMERRFSRLVLAADELINQSLLLSEVLEQL